jgi:hypothetical protein
MKSWQSYSEKYELYHHSETLAWDYTQDRPYNLDSRKHITRKALYPLKIKSFDIFRLKIFIVMSRTHNMIAFQRLCGFVPTSLGKSGNPGYKGDVIKGNKRMYLHLYYNPEKAVEDGKRFNHYMTKLQNELLSGKKLLEHESAYKIFETKTTPVRGMQVTPRQEAMDEARSRYGFFILLSNEVKDAIAALELYRNRDVVEKAFGNLKDRLNGRRTLVSSDQSLEGKLFVEFIALIYLSYIKKKMEERDLFKKYTLQSLLDKLDVIESYEAPGNAVIVGEVLKKQSKLYEEMDVPVPVSVTSLG